jgi:HSP20 family molecular chaperone IbpA
MKQIKVQVAESIWDQVEEVRDKIRTRAYERYLNRGCEPCRDLEDWLAAEAELVAELPAVISEEENRIVASIETEGIEARDLSVIATTQELMIRGETEGRFAIAVVELSQPVDPTSVRAEYNSGSLRITAPIPISTARHLQKTA